MRVNPIRQHPLCPEWLSIDEMGWKVFLENWDREAFECLKTQTLRYGVYLGGRKDHKQYHEHNEQYKKKLEAKLECELPNELFFGGVTYPGTTLAEEQFAADKFKEICEAVARAIAHDPWVHCDNKRQVLARGTHLFPPATEQEIIDTEKRFGLALPPPYRAFLQASNGCLLALGWTLLPVTKIGWLKDMNIYVINSDMMEYIEEGPDMIPDEVYYDYDDLGMIEEPFPFYRPQKLLNAVCISNPRDSADQGMSIYPPLPDSPIHDGEWETFSSCGYRARSFKHMMEYKYLDIILGWRTDLDRWAKM